MSQKYLPSTSRDLDPTNYAWDSVVYQAGRPMLDSELNLTQDVLNKRSTLPSGMISYQGQDDSIGSFVFEKPYDEAGNLNGNFTANAFVINPFKAMVNGMVIDVRNTGATDGTNKVQLLEAESGGGNNAGVRAEFVFLEVWRREVTPAMQAKSRIKVKAHPDGARLTFKKGGSSVHLDLGANADFQAGASLPETARNLAEAINNHGGNNAGLTVDGVTTRAETRGTEYLFLNHNNGASGNYNSNVAASFQLESLNSGNILIIDQPAGGSDGEGMSSQNNIFFAGNVLAPTAKDLPDNIQDPNVNISSTRRVQVQYRIRSFPTTNLSQHIFGFENNLVVAQGSKGNPVASYTFSKHDTDTGLWYAGNGSEAHSTALGTVDGYVYAIPLCYVFRRFSATNGTDGFSGLFFNTGAKHDHAGNLTQNPYVDNVAVKHSDRPDGLFADEIAEQDVLDLRRRVYPRGIDFSSELQYQYDSLLDDTNKTWFAIADDLQNTGNQSGGASHTPLVCDAYGSQVNLQNVGEHRSMFDHIARRWSNEPTTERIYLEIKPSNQAQVSSAITVNSGGGAGTTWHEGDTIQISLDLLDISGTLGFATNNDLRIQNHFGNNVPKLLDIGYCWHNDGHFFNSIEQQVKFKSISGLGSTTVVLTLDKNPIIANGGMMPTVNYNSANPYDANGNGNDLDYRLVGDAVSGVSTGSNKQLFIELIFDYGSLDRGLSGTVAESPTPNISGYPTGPAIVTNTEPLNAFDPYGLGNGNAPPVSNIIPNTKEVSLEYIYASQVIDLVSNSDTSTYLPWRLYYNANLAPTITDQSGFTDANGGTNCTLENSSTNYQHAESKIGWTNSGGVWNSGQRKVRVTAHPLEPYTLDSTNTTALVFYRRHAPKTVGADFPVAQPVNTAQGGVVPVELNLQPLAMAKEISVYLKTTEHYPFFNPTDQLATHNNANATYNEYKVLGSPEVILDDLKINTGSVSLPSFVPFVSSVNFTFGGTDVGEVPRKDPEGRVFYPTIKQGEYFPSAFAKNMGGFHTNYKTTIPCLMKVVDDNHLLYRKGEVLLVVFVKTNTWGNEVSVDMRSTLAENYVAVCVYRTRNQLLLGE